MSKPSCVKPVIAVAVPIAVALVVVSVALAMVVHRVESPATVTVTVSVTYTLTTEVFREIAEGQPLISITSIIARSLNNRLVFEIYLVNSGAGSDRLAKVDVVHRGTSISYTLTATSTATFPADTSLIVSNAGPLIIPGNTRGWLTIVTDYSRITPGDTVILRSYFERSGVQTINVVVGQ